MDPISTKIKHLRELHGLSQRELAKACSVSHASVSKWESGETANIKLANLIAMCKKLGTNPNAILGVDIPSNKQSEYAARDSAHVESYAERAQNGLIGHIAPRLSKVYSAADDKERELINTQIDVLLDTIERMIKSRPSKQTVA